MTELSRIYSNINTLKEVKCPYNEQKNINSIALHSNNIKVIEQGILQQFTNLTLLDLSSNQIEKIQGLDKLYNLKTLNLSNNKIKIIEGLSELRALSKLLLAYNKIKTLEGFVQLHGINYSLFVLDLKGNNIDDINEIKYLTGCSKLKHLIVKNRKKNVYSKNSRVNPFCQRLADTYRKEIKIMVPQLESIDEIDFYGNELEINEIGNSNINSYKSFLNTINEDESYRMNNIIEQQNYKSNNKIEETQINDINQRIKNVELALQSIAENKNNEKTQKLDTITQEDLKNAFEHALNCFSKTKSNINNENDENKENKEISNDNSKPNNIINSKNNSDFNNSKLNSIENQISEIMKLLVSNNNISNINYNDKNLHMNDNKNNKNIKLINDTISMNEYKIQLEDIKTKIIDDLKNNISLLNFNNLDDNKDNNIPVKLVEKSKDNNNSRKRNNDNHKNKRIHSDKSKIDSKKIENLRNEDISESEIEESENSNSNVVTKENQRFIHIDPNKELLKSIDDLNIELAKIKKENFELQDVIEKSKIKSKKQEEYCMELEKKVKMNIENEKKFHSDYLEIKDQIMLMENQIKEKDMLNNKLNDELQDKDYQCKQMDIEISILKNKIEENNGKSIGDEIKNVEEKLREALNEKAKLSLRFLREKEQYKCKMADAHKEVEIYQTTIKQFQQRVIELQEVISTKDKEFNQKERKIRKEYEDKIDDISKSISEELSDRYQNELENVEKRLSSSKKAYKELEEEFRFALNNEQTKNTEIQMTLDELIKQYKAQTKQLTEYQNNIACKDKTIDETSKLNEKLQNELTELENKYKACLNIYEGKIYSMEEKLKQFNKIKTEKKMLQKELDNEKQNHKKALEEKKQISKDMLEKISVIHDGNNNYELKYNNLIEKYKSLEKENIELKEKNKTIEETSNKIKNEQETLEYKLKVKEKMLDDQNDTIKNLKQNLEAKIKDSQNVRAEFEEKYDDACNQLSIEIKNNEELQSEFSILEKQYGKIKVENQDYKEECHSLKEELNEVYSKLKERNESIKMIEEEIMKLKTVFKSKEQKFIQDSKVEIDKRNEEIKKLQESIQNQYLNNINIEKGKNEAIIALKQLQETHQKTLKEKQQCENDLKVVLVEMEKQKTIMNERMKKLQDAFFLS